MPPNHEVEAADALAWMASAEVADDDVLGGVHTDQQALARVGGIRSFGLARVPLTLYWAGRLGEAADHAVDAELGVRLAADDARAAVQVARRLGDPAVLLDCLAVLLNIDGNDGVLDEARRTIENILGMLSQESLRSAFVRSLSARQLGALGR